MTMTRAEVIESLKNAVVELSGSPREATLRAAVELLSPSTDAEIEAAQRQIAMSREASIAPNSPAWTTIDRALDALVCAPDGRWRSLALSQGATINEQKRLCDHLQENLDERHARVAALEMQLARMRAATTALRAAWRGPQRHYVDTILKPVGELIAALDAAPASARGTLAHVRSEFHECAACAAKPGMPDLCRECLERRTLYSLLKPELVCPTCRGGCDPECPEHGR